MFLHTGNGRIVFHRELIGIFSHDLIIGKKGEENEKIWLQNDLQLKTGKGRSQSIVITDRGTYTAPISPLTLAGRSMK